MTKTIDIKVIKKITDDEITCGGIGNRKRCDYAYHSVGKWRCSEFSNQEIHVSIWSIIKCLPCREAWNKAKDDLEA